MQMEETILPVLRTDLQLNEAPPEPDGSPTWTLYDPAANKYYKIGWLEFECLVRFKECQTASQLVQRIEGETTLSPDEDTVKALIVFLMHNHLVLTPGAGVADHLETKRKKMEKPWWKTALHGYLFFTLPLFRPENFLRKTFPLLRPLFTPTFMMLVLCALCYGIFLSVQRFDELLTTFLSYLNFEGVALFLLVTILVKIIHELGHAYTATKYGVPVSVIGVAFIVMYPILYTETTNAWKMRNRRERLIIAGGGLMAEMTLAAAALLAWHMLPPGVLQSLCFMVGVVSLIASIVINLNPLMRFDGYYLFSDFIGIDNLQDRAFAMAKWRMRRVLFGWDDPVPEIADRDRARLLTVFGYATWVYRFFLYLGIGLLVYHLFFQPLGLILMVIELGFFIGLPILREVKVWGERYREAAATWRGRSVIALLLLAFLSIFIPVNRSIEIPAVMHAANYTRFYPPIAGRVDSIFVTRGQDVAEGALLFRLSSPELDYNLKVVRTRLKNLIDIRNASQADPELARKRLMIANEIAGAETELAGLLEIEKKLEIRAPFAGVVRDIDPTLHEGQWVSSDVLLALLTDRDALRVSGYINEQDARRLGAMRTGVFYPEYATFGSFDVMLADVGETGVGDIFWQELSSLHGGSVPSERGAGGGIKILPRYTFYPVEFQLTNFDGQETVPFIARGAIRLAAAPQSFASALFNKAVSYLRTDSGF